MPGADGAVVYFHADLRKRETARNMAGETGKTEARCRNVSDACARPARRLLVLLYTSRNVEVDLRRPVLAVWRSSVSADCRYSVARIRSPVVQADAAAVGDRFLRCASLPS